MTSVNIDIYADGADVDEMLDALERPTPLPIVPQDGDDPRELYASLLVKLMPLAEPVEGVLNEIEETARTEGIPIVGRLEGSILQILTMLHGRRAMRILDIGTAIGYSAIWLAAALAPGGTVTTIELDPERAQRARRYIERAGFADRVDVLEGDAFDVIPTLGTYDLIFQDVMKHVYFGSDPGLALSLLRLTVEHLAPAGVLMIDNALCGNGIIEPGAHSASNQLAGVQALNHALSRDPAFRSVILPVRDGLWLAQRVA
ncbi:O-methyltransferase [uncultured Mycobacterium sp.]|uniref:O-methyltransferase n=1 Tax=uncultured Mycobacterium sp. TaxID=171292 RepID=UPI0035CB53AA